MKAIGWGVVIGGLLLVGLPLLLIGGCALGWFSEAANVMREQVGPRAALKKYEEFKDIAATLEAKLATIKVSESRMKALEESYKGVPRKDWPRVDAEQHSLWTQETAGMKASYNALAADYNARMAKENFRFANVGELPQGASTPLPREFKTYLEN